MECLIGQIPIGSEEVIKLASSRSWEVALLVVMVISVFTFLGYVLRRTWDSSEKREIRISERVTALESEIRTELFAQMKLNSEVITKMSESANRIGAAADRMIQTLEKFEITMSARPCLATTKSYAGIMAGEVRDKSLERD